MSLSDDQLELIDRYLDADLPDTESAAFEARVRADSTLAGALEAQRASRAQRRAVLVGLEPTDVELQRLQWMLRGALRQPAAPQLDDASWTQHAAWLLRGATKVAAVLAIGFAVGYAYRAPAPGSGNGAPVANGGLVVGGGVDPTSDLIQPVSALAVQQDPTSSTGGGYEVALKDQTGNVIARQKFRTLQEARDFANELDRWQQRYRQVQKNGVRFVGDDF
jgi:anti-sigma factor RsiW